MKPSSSCGSNTLLTVLFQSRPKGCYNNNYSLVTDLAAREFNAFLWIALIAVSALLLRDLVQLLRAWALAKSIPGPPCPSFYGHFHLLSRQNLTDVLTDLHKKYGSVVKLWLGPTQLLVSIKDQTLIRETLLKAADKLPMTGRAFHLAFGSSTLFASSFDQIYSEVAMAQKDSMKEDQNNAHKMVLLLATIFESARLVSAGSLLQRCSLKHDFTLRNGQIIPAGAGLVVPVELV